MGALKSICFRRNSGKDVLLSNFAVNKIKLWKNHQPMMFHYQNIVERNDRYFSIWNNGRLLLKISQNWIFKMYLSLLTPFFCFFRSSQPVKFVVFFLYLHRFKSVQNLRRHMLLRNSKFLLLSFPKTFELIFFNKIQGIYQNILKAGFSFENVFFSYEKY